MSILTPEELSEALAQAEPLGQHPHERTWLLARPDGARLTLKAGRLPAEGAPSARALRHPPPPGVCAWVGAARMPAPTCRQLGLAEGPWYLVARPWVPGRTLEALAPRELRARWARLALRLGHQVRELHEVGWPHGDLQPQNVLVDEQDTVHLIDVPLLAQADPEQRGVAGSAPLMAPELWAGQPPSRPADVYALGCLLCWMAAPKRYPRVGHDLASWARAHRDQPPELPAATLGGKLAGVLERALDARPARRPGLQELLDAIAPRDDVDAPAPPPLCAPAPPHPELLEELASAPPPDQHRALVLRGARGAGKSAALEALCMRRELGTRATYLIQADALDARAWGRITPGALEHARGAWGPATGLLARLCSLAGRRVPELQLGRGDRLHALEALSAAALEVWPEAGLTLLWDDLDRASPDVRAWVGHVRRAARQRGADLELIASAQPGSALELPGVIERALPQPDARRWRRWRAHTLRAEVRDIARGRFEELLDRHGATTGQLLAALDAEIGATPPAASPGRPDGGEPPEDLEAIDALLEQGAFGQALIACERLAAAGPAEDLALLERWVEAALRAGAEPGGDAELLGQLDGARAQPRSAAEQLELALLHTQLLHRRGRHDEGLDRLDALEIDEEALEAKPRARLELMRAQLCISSGQLDAARALACAGLESLGVEPEQRPAGELATHLRVLEHAAGALRGEPEALEALQGLERALEDPATPALVRARAHAYQAIGLGRLDEREASAKAHLRALEAIERAGLAAELPTYLLNAGTAYHSQGKLGLAHEYYARGTRLAQPNTRATTRALLLLNQADIDTTLGRTAEARALLAAARALARRHELRQHELMTLAYEGSLLASRGDPAEATELLQTCLAAEPPPPVRAEILLDLTLAAARADHLELAREHLEQAHALLEAHALAALQDHHGVLAGRLQWGEGDSLGVMAGIERFRTSLIAALESANYRLVLEHSPALMRKLDEQDQPELMRQLAELNQRARRAVASGLGRELREDFFSNHPPLAPPEASAELAPDAPRPPGAGRGLVRPPVQAGPARDETIERFYRMLSLNEVILHTEDVEQLWDRALEIALSLSGAERGFLLLRQPGPKTAGRLGGFEVTASRDLGGDAIARPHLKVSVTIAEEAARTGRTVATLDAGQDERFQSALSVVDLDLTSVLCVPVRDASGLLGALYLDHRFEPGVFGGETQRMMEAFGHQLALAITNARRLERLEATVAELEDARDELDALLAEREATLAGMERRVATLSEDLERRRDAQLGGLRAAFPQIAYASRAMERVLRQVDRVARSAIPVVVTGESGVGKELIASAVHQASARASGPFIPVNCGAIPAELFESELFGHIKGAFTGADRARPGLFRAADGGTIFLDELGEMPLSMQVKLLRVLQEGKVRPVGATRPDPVDARVVAATNRDLGRMVDEGDFRQDLYYRLAGFTLQVPPLHERREDIPLIAHTLLERLAPETIDRPLRLTPQAARLLSECAWPGNVRQLENVLRAACVMCEGDAITEREIAPLIELRGPDASSSGAPPSTSSSSRGAPRASSRGRGRRPKARRDEVAEALADADGDIAQTAARLGVSERTVYRYLNRYGLET